MNQPQHNPLEVVCPVCLSAVGAECTHKVRDGCQNQKEFHPLRHALARAKWEKENEPVFILRAQDRSACQLVQLWITLNPQVSEEKMLSAVQTLDKMRAWPKKKVAD